MKDKSYCASSCHFFSGILVDTNNFSTKTQSTVALADSVALSFKSMTPNSSALLKFPHVLEDEDLACVRGFVAPRQMSHNRTKCHRASPGGHTEQTPKPTTEGTQQPWNKGDGLFFFLFFPPLASRFYSGRAAPAFLPACRAGSCLYRAFPTATTTTTHVPIRLTGPVTSLNAKPHRKTGRRNGPGRHAGTLTLAPDLPRFTITLGGRGAAFRDHLGHDDSAATTTPPAPFFSLTRQSVVFIRRLIMGIMGEKKTKKLDPLDYFFRFYVLMYLPGAVIVKQFAGDLISVNFLEMPLYLHAFQ